nr:hypothetical protein [uncultured Mediterranean phage uvMED]
MAETKARFLADQISTTDANQSFTLPTTRGADNYVLTRDDSAGTGGTAWKETTLTPTISSITYPTQNGVQATALAATGAQDTTAETLLINGQNFTSTVTVNISGNGVSSSAFAGTVSVNTAGTVITCSSVTKQASADNYTLTVTNSTNLNITTTVNFSADPSFTTGSGSLGQVFTTLATTKTITAGSSVSWYEGTPTMPTWMTHFADADTGTSKDLTGTPTNTGTTEVQNFNIIIRDSENQSHNRDFSLTVSDAPTGGTINNSVTGYRIHWWKYADTGGSFQIYAPLTAQILVVAGGGGGGGQSGAGGGAGGLRMGTISIPTGTYTITVGNGGTAGASPANGGTGGLGGDSSIGTLIVSKGGGGGGGYDVDGANGGSAGGGASGNNGASNGGSALALNPSQVTGETYNYQGKDGGDSKYASGSSYSHGGGGGASAEGQTPAGPTSAGGNGGTGRASNIITTSIASSNSIGQVSGGSVYFSGGGAGTSFNGSSSIVSGSAGLGGGATGASSETTGNSATANTGGGGGGGVNAAGGAGGSGIIVIRYAI